MRLSASYALIALAAALAGPAALTAQGDPTPPPTEESEAVPQPRARPTSWTSDRRTFRAGDLVTIFIDEQTLATATSDNVAFDNRRFDGVLTQLPSSRLGVLSRNNSESERSGRARRIGQFQAEITARIVSIDANGILQIEGRKAVKVDEHEHAIAITGVARAQDITGSNIIDAWRISGLDLRYESNGELAKPSRGVLAKILSIIF